MPTSQLPTCPHRGRIVASAGKCFCRAGESRQLVSFDQCEQCPLIGLAPLSDDNGEPKKSRLPIGDWVSNGLSAIGITKDRVSKVAGGDCGCTGRQKKLNEIGDKIAGKLMQ